MLDLGGSRAHEMPGVRVHRRHRPIAMVKILFMRAPGNAVVFEPGELPRAIGRQGIAEVFDRKIEPDVSVEVAIGGITGVAFFRAPDLAARFPVPAKGRGTRRREDRRIDRVTRAGVSKHDSVRIDDEPPEICFLEHLVEGRCIRAFRQPDPARIAAKGFAIVIPGDEDLRPHCFREVFHQRQKSVGGRAGDNLQRSTLLKASKGADEVAFPDLHEFSMTIGEPPEVKPRDFVQPAIAMGAFDFLAGELERAGEVTLVTLDEQRVAQHVAKRRRKRERELKPHLVLRQT